MTLILQLLSIDVFNSFSAFPTANYFRITNSEISVFNLKLIFQRIKCNEIFNGFLLYDMAMFSLLWQMKLGSIKQALFECYKETL